MVPYGRIIFFSLALIILISLQILVYYTFRKFLRKRNFGKITINLMTFIPSVLFNLPFLWAFFNRFDFSQYPKPLYSLYIMPFYIYQGSMLLISLYLLAGKIIKLIINIPIFILKRFRVIREKIEKFKTKKNVIRYDKSRRAFLTTSAALVSGYAFIGSGLGVIRKDNYEITYQDIKIKNLPPELNGTTLTLISDIHSGPFMDTDTMKEYCDVINDIGSDLILIPGDLTNTKKEEVHPFVKSFMNLKAKYGVYATLGNHDYFSDPDYIANVVSNESPIKMLRNESEFININGKEFCLLGIEDVGSSGDKGSETIVGNLYSTLEKTDKKYKDLPKILLYHKPYILRYIALKKIDLMLSGHTHGGQIVFAKFGKFNLSIAATVSNLISGHYTMGDSNLYVSRGIGTVGFPMRLNCPPEITQIKLIS